MNRRKGFRLDYKRFGRHSRKGDVRLQLHMAFVGQRSHPRQGGEGTRTMYLPVEHTASTWYARTTLRLAYNRKDSLELHLSHFNYLYSPLSSDVVQTTQNSSLQTCHQHRTHSGLYHSHQLIIRTRTPSCTHPSFICNHNNALPRTKLP